MGKTIRYTGKAKDTINRLKISRQNFKVVTTSKTEKIVTSRVNYFFAEKHYYGKIFGLLAQLKKQLNEREEIIINAPFSGSSKDVKYFQFNSEQNFKTDVGTIYEIPDVIEADITQAYYTTAFNLGFITEDFYIKCKNLEKADRLILIGSIATVKTVDNYIDGAKTTTDILKNDLHRMAWFKICSYVDACLITILERFNEISPDIFLFYWVDGIYFRRFEVTKKYNWQTVFKEINSVYPFKWKIQRIKKLRVLNKGKDGLKIEISKENGETKTFYPPKREIKIYSMDKDGKPVNLDSQALTVMDRLIF